MIYRLSLVNVFVSPGLAVYVLEMPQFFDAVVLMILDVSNR